MEFKHHSTLRHTPLHLHHTHCDSKSSFTTILTRTECDTWKERDSGPEATGVLKEQRDVRRTDVRGEDTTSA